MMRLLLIRHAEAVEADSFDGGDLERPLTPKGRRDARTMARAVARCYPRVDAVISSAAERSLATAKTVARAVGVRKVAVEPSLNPGASAKDYHRLLDRTSVPEGTLVMVGHEPDLSGVLSNLVAPDGLALKFKKGACAEVELIAPRRGNLRALLDPALVKSIR